VTARAAAEVAAAADVPMTVRVASSRWACRSAAVQRSRDRAAGRRARPSVLPRSRRPEPARIAGRTRGCDPAGLEGYAQGLLPEPPGTLPLATPGPGDTVALLGALRKIPVPRLRAPLRGNEPADVAGELRGIVAELYDVTERYWPPGWSGPGRSAEYPFCADVRGGRSADRGVPNGGSRAMSDQDRQHSVTNADVHHGALPNPGAVRLAKHMGGRGQRRQALQSIRPDGVTLEGAALGPAPCDRPRSRRPYRSTGEPRCLAPYREPRAFPSAEASTWC
jgi:hypothetical protein